MYNRNERFHLDNELENYTQYRLVSENPNLGRSQIERL
jgi:hypothetical protein